MTDEAKQNKDFRKMTHEITGEDTFKGLEPFGNTPVAPAHGIAAIALNMAMKYHDISTIKDGALYQQFKLEGRNIQTIHLDHVFETAIRIEAWLLGASDRIAKLVVDAITIKVDGEDDPEPPPPDNSASDTP